MWVPAVVHHQPADDTESPLPTMIGELQECPDIVAGKMQMPRATSRPGSCHIGPGSVKAQWNTSISGLDHAAECDTSPMPKAKPVHQVSFYSSI